MTVSVSVTHTFEAGHRLPCLPGKCQSLHGHSWRVLATVAAPEAAPRTGTIVQFGHLKRELRAFIDTQLDHGLMLGGTDELVPILSPHGKVFRFASPVLTDPPPTSELAADLYWPSVENVATLLARFVASILPDCEPVGGAYVHSVEVSETPTNTARWSAS